MARADIKYLFNALAFRAGLTPESLLGLTGGQVSAQRLQLLSDIVDDLEGSYNKQGISQWFDRKRVQLSDRSPREILGNPWQPEEEAPQRVLRLARS